MASAMFNHSLSAQGRTHMTDAGQKVVEVAPPAAAATVGILTWVGVHLPQIVQVVSLVYMLFYLAERCFRIGQWWMAKRAQR